jgi:peptidoglycan endopeptidase LytE
MLGRWAFFTAGLFILFLSLGIQEKGMAEERYMVKSGDNLSSISKAYGVNIEVLRKVNHLKGNSIKPKQVLLIPSSKEKQTVGIPKNNSIQNFQRPSGEISKKSSGMVESYVVEKGDSLYSVSKKVGLSIEEIKKMNGLQFASLKIGQKLLFSKQKNEGAEEVEELGDVEESAEFSYTAEDKTEEQLAHIGKWSTPEERSLFVRVVKNFLGVPYRLGGSTLKGIDCSGFVKKIYEIFNVHLPRTAREQFGFGKKIEKDKLEEGDLVFFRRQGNDAHVGIYIGDNQFIHASSRKREVKIDHLDMPYFNTHFIKGVRIKELERDS